MKNISLYILALATITHSQLLESGHKAEEYRAIDNLNANNLFVNLSTECGGEILNTATGGIHYKIRETLEHNERCVWIIQVSAATGFHVMTETGFPEISIDHQLQITSFEGDNEPNTLIPDTAGSYDLNGTSTLLVTFFTGNGSDVINHSGFILEYTTYFDGTPSIPYMLSSFENASIEHLINPGINAAYFNSLQIYVYNWGDKTVNSRNTMKMFYEREEGWTSVTRLEVYKFQPESSWQLQNVMDLNSPIPMMMESNEILFFALRKNGTASSHQYAKIGNFNCLDRSDLLN